MRVFCSAFGHETNSFSPIPTDRASFEQTILIRPGDPRMSRKLRVMGIDTVVAEATRLDCQLTLSTVAFAQPSGPMVTSDYEVMRDEILTDLETAGPQDLIVLILHGAMMAIGYDDCEGDLLGRVRELVGPEPKIGVLLDLHGNVTDAMVDNATVIMGCREYPHVDFDERAGELFACLLDAAASNAELTTSQVRIPMLATFHTPREPMRSFVDRARSFEEQDGVVQVTLMHGFAWSDFADVGASVLVTTNDDPVQAQQIATELAKEFFELRTEGTEPLLSVPDMLDTVERSDQGTVVVSDGSDNAGGGSASDATHIARACLDRGLEGVVIGLLWDPESVDEAFAAGEGATIPMRIGAKVSSIAGQPLDVDATVLKLASGKKHQLYTEDYWVPLGRTALVEVAGVQIVINDIRQQPMHPSAFLEAGCDPWSKRLVIVKSSQHFYAGFSEQAVAVLYCDTPGTLGADAFARPYKKIRRPIWPLDHIEFVVS